MKMCVGSQQNYNMLTEKHPNMKFLPHQHKVVSGRNSVVKMGLKYKRRCKTGPHLYATENN